jgi:hypothetical protein
MGSQEIRGHAVVITGIDTETPTCWMNNPWGSKDREVSVGAVFKRSFNTRALAPISRTTSLLFSAFSDWVVVQCSAKSGEHKAW